MEPIITIIPVKNFESSKLRLAHLFSEAERKNLSYFMLMDVINALKEIQYIIKIVITTPMEDIPGLSNCLNKKIKILCDPINDLNGAIAEAINFCKYNHFNNSMFLIMPSDIPMVRSTDIIDLINNKLNSEAQITLVPSNRNDGTNSILFDSSIKLKTYFGPNSFDKHKKIYEKKYKISVFNSYRIGFDVDYEEDLKILYNYIQVENTFTLKYLKTLNIFNK
ncbi:MAG: 2-phospho-L-lactate guanylyltransferase [Candidatus Helarchaeota archaeon]